MLIPSFIKKQANYGRIRSVSLSEQTMVIAVSPRNRSAARVRLDHIVSKKNTSIVNDYNKYMGGCDLAGQLCKYYTHNHRTLKWWKRLFVTILDMCLLNATIVYNSIPTKSRLSGLEFRVKVIEGLLSPPGSITQHSMPINSRVPGPQVNIHTFLDAVARNGTVLYAVQSLREDKLVRYVNIIISQCV